MIDCIRCLFIYCFQSIFSLLQLLYVNIISFKLNYHQLFIHSPCSKLLAIELYSKKPWSKTLKIRIQTMIQNQSEIEFLSIL